MKSRQRGTSPRLSSNRSKQRPPEQSKILWFQRRLASWFTDNKRDFVWRASSQPYLLCVSEILLQQTAANRVAEVIIPFIERFPDWETLAVADITEVQELIFPLGIHRRRASTLVALAEELVKAGSMPTTRDGLERLPGIGQYIASVLLVTLQHRREPFLDVNMARVIERFFGPREMADIRCDPYLQILARKVVNVEDALSANWMILDFAALVCMKNRPRCSTCLLAPRCVYRCKTTS